VEPGETITDRVCTECGDGYARRPALKATWTRDDEPASSHDRERDAEEEEGEAPDTYLDGVDGHWYVVSYGRRPQVHALDCKTCADAHQGSAWVVVHEVTREYGGPEEGGWWFDEGRVVYRRRVLPDESQAVIVEQVERTFDTTTSHRFSMAARGSDYRVSIGEDRGEDYPETRPHYE
jgi:hypothetical protein